MKRLIRWAGAWGVLGGLTTMGIAGCTSVSETETPADVSPHERLEGDTGTRWIVEIDPATDTPRIATAVDPIPSSAETALEVQALQFLERYKDLFKIEAPADELQFLDIVVVEGLSVARFQQRAKGIPIDRKTVSVWFRADRSIGSIVGSTHPQAAEAAVEPAISAEAARSAIEADLVARYPSFQASWIKGDATPRAVLIPEGPGAKLAWALRVRVEGPLWATALSYRIDAQTGAVLEGFEDVPSLRGTGLDVFGVSREFEVIEDAPGDYYMVQKASESRTQISTSSLEPLQAPIQSDSLVSWDPRTAAEGGVGAAVSAHANLGEIDDYFRRRFDWASFDNQGTPLKIVVHDSRAALAQWNRADASLHFHDGDVHAGGDLKPLAGARDICAHEYMHAVLEHLIPGGGLTYYGESGAVSESLADIFGVFAKLATSEGSSPSLVGEELTPGGVRDLANPTNPAALVNREVAPEHVNRDSYKELFKGEFDNGGVHVNSGVLANAWYLMTFGGSHAFTDVSVREPLGITKSEDLWWLTASSLLPSVDIAMAAEAVTHGALLLYKKESPELTAVACAFAAVEIFSVEEVEATYAIQCAPPCAEPASNSCSCVGTEGLLCKSSPSKGGACTDYSSFEGNHGRICNGYRLQEVEVAQCACQMNDGTYLCKSQMEISPQRCPEPNGLDSYEGRDGEPCTGNYLDLDFLTNQVVQASGAGVLVDCQETTAEQKWVPAAGVLDCGGEANEQRCE